MPDYIKPNVEDILKKHGARIEGQIGTVSNSNSDYSRQYLNFKEEMSPDLSRYERWCRGLGSVIKLKVSSKDEIKLKKYIAIAHLDIEPWQALTLSVMVFMSSFVIGLLTSALFIFISGNF